MQVGQKESIPIVEEFFDCIDHSPFLGKNTLTKAAEYTLSRAMGLKAFLDDGHLENDKTTLKMRFVRMSMAAKIGSSL